MSPSSTSAAPRPSQVRDSSNGPQSLVERLAASNLMLARTNAKLTATLESMRATGWGSPSVVRQTPTSHDASWDELASKWSEYNVHAANLRECICDFEKREIALETRLVEVEARRSSNAGVVHDSVHQARLDELLRTFRAIPKDRKNNPLSAKESKSMRYLLNKYQKYTEKTCLKDTSFERLQLFSWYGEEGDSDGRISMYFEDVSAFIDASVALSTEHLDVAFYHGEEHDPILDDLVHFFMPQLIGIKSELEAYIKNKISNTIVIRNRGKIIAASVFYTGATVYDVPIFDVQLFACSVDCAQMRLSQEDWASHVLLGSMRKLCKRPTFHVVAQSVGYNYLLAKTDGDNDSAMHQTVTIQEEHSKGRIFWAKHLQRDFASVILGAQMMCTDDASVHGDCTFMHYECSQ